MRQATTSNSVWLSRLGINVELQTELIRRSPFFPRKPLPFKTMNLEIRLTIQQMRHTKSKGVNKPPKEYLRHIEIDESQFDELTSELRQEIIDKETKEFLDDYVTIEAKVL